jgi:HNH endonuclease
MAFSEEVKSAVRKRAHFRCCACRDLYVEIHHIIPQAEGGHDTEDNAAPLCPSCHERWGANPTKRKFIMEMRDAWYEILQQRPRLGSGLVASFSPLDNRLKDNTTSERLQVNGIDSGLVVWTVGSIARLQSVEDQQVLTFDDTVRQRSLFSSILSPAYNGGGVLVRLHFSPLHSSSGSVTWLLDMRRDLVSDRKAAAQGPAPLRNIAGSQFSMAEWKLAPEQMGSTGPGDPFALSIVRDAVDRDDTTVGAVAVHGVELFDLASLPG